MSSESPAEPNPLATLPALSVALAGCAELALGDVVASLLRIVHGLRPLLEELDDRALASDLRSELVAIVARGRRLEAVPRTDTDLPAGYGAAGDDDGATYALPEVEETAAGLARLLGPAMIAAERGASAGPELFAMLDAALHDDLDEVARRRRWFGIDRTLPGTTPFDPTRHRALAGIRRPGSSGLVVHVHRPGRLDAHTGAVSTPAEVIVAE